MTLLLVATIEVLFPLATGQLLNVVSDTSSRQEELRKTLAPGSLWGYFCLLVFRAAVGFGFWFCF